jgi:hypothetical protein
MTQYDDAVEYQKYRIEAETWAKQVRSLHAHSLDSMWYGAGRSDGSVTDVEYMDGRVERTINSTGKVIMLNEENVISGEDLVNLFLRGGK